MKLSIHAKDVMDNRNIPEKWVYCVLNDPSLIIEIKEDEVHYYGMIETHDNRCLKVVVNPLKALVVTTYFDRKMQKKGCK
ncbi:MAG: DUF4258 domain-containing protein [Sulfurovum sp.]|nr:DUF4258 domain-containing protein [Sulfurovum sp.]